MCFYKTLIHLAGVLRKMTVLFRASYLRILHCHCRLMVLNKPLNHLERFFLFNSVIKTNSEIRILLYETAFSLNVPAFFSSALITLSGFSVSSLGLLLACVKALSFVLRSKKRKVADLQCLTLYNAYNGKGDIC